MQQAVNLFHRSSRHAIKILTHRIHLLARIAHERDSVKAANRMEHIQLHQCPHRADGHQIRCTNKHIHSVCIREGQLPRFFLTEISVFDGQLQRKLLCQLLHPCNPFSGYKGLFIPCDIKDLCTAFIAEDRLFCDFVLGIFLVNPDRRRIPVMIGCVNQHDFKRTRRNQLS